MINTFTSSFDITAEPSEQDQETRSPLAAEPTLQTIKNILNYSHNLEVIKVSNGVVLEYLKS